ncbi:MAG: Hsp20/alpha crystallin family protein [Candidatus Kapaibacterium sp.]|nr:MAG: Hsp20/alpha crystallin family protein [Candidatus Kapabacteria bacterium]
MRNFSYNFDPRDFQRFQNAAETVADRLGDFFNEMNKNINVDVDITKQKQGVKSRIDVIEDENNVYVHAELPGIAKEDVLVSMSEDKVLTIKANKRRLYDDNARSIRNERAFGEYTRTITIEQEIKTDSISATFRDGVLTVTLPKPESARPKTVNINIQ